MSSDKKYLTVMAEAYLSTPYGLPLQTSIKYLEKWKNPLEGIMELEQFFNHANNHETYSGKSTEKLLREFMGLRTKSIELNIRAHTFVFCEAENFVKNTKLNYFKDYRGNFHPVLPLRNDNPILPKPQMNYSLH